MRYMAVIARCNGMMTCLLPTIVLFAHDMTVCTSISRTYAKWGVTCLCVARRQVSRW